MNLRILDSASRDLLEGYRFYEKQQQGLGTYFIDSLFSDIDALLLYVGIHTVHFRQFHRALSKRFPFAIYSSNRKCWFTLCWIVAAARPGSGSI